MNRILTAILLLPLTAVGQNLIPNPNFEEHVEGRVTEWGQPNPPYYHFTVDARTDGGAHNGECYNGLCIANYQEGGDINERLIVRLHEPLVAGQKYRLKMMVRERVSSNKNPDNMDAIHWYFSNNKEDRTLQELSPTQLEHRVVFPLPDTGMFSWTAMETNYTASGNEVFLLIGYFNEKMGFRNLDQTKPTAPAPSFYPDFSNKKKKSKKKQEKENAQFRKQQREYLKERYKDLFRVRFYFDALCLAPLTSEGTCDCSPPGETVDDATETYAVGETIVLNNIFFETAKSALLPASFEELEKLLQLLQQQPEAVIQVNGHTDNQGNDDDNQALSENRAQAVVNYLIEQGIAANRLTSKGFGSKVPVATNDTAEGREQNRRVEFVILSR